MKTKIFTYLILLPLLLGISSYVDAQITSKIFGVGPNTVNNTADDIVLVPPFPGAGGFNATAQVINIAVSGLPVLSQDFNLDLINFFGSLPVGWTTISLTSPKGTTYVLANKSLGSWPGYLYDATMNRVNQRQINQDCSDAPAHNGTGIIIGVKSLNPTNSFIGEDPNGTWKFTIGPTSYIGSEGLYYDRISLLFRYASPYLATSTVTKPTSCTAADGNVKFKLYVGGCNLKGGFYKINGGALKFVPYNNKALSDEITEGSLTAGTYGIQVFPAINSTTPDLTKVHSTLFIIEDSTPPAISCPPAQTVTLDGTGKNIFNITHPTATDDCGIPTTVLNVKYYDGASDAIGGLTYNNLKVSPGVSKPYNIKGVGKVVFEFVTKDASGLTTTCSTTVTSLANTNYCANDTEAPFFPFGECRDYFIVYDENSQASFSFRAPYYFDNCEIATRKVTGTYLGGASPVSGPTIFSADFVSGIYSPYTITGAGSLELKFEVTDKKGNKGTCTSIITAKIRTGPCLNDLTKPVLTNCHANATINLNNTTNQAAFKYTTPLLSDNCGVDSTRITMTYLDGATGILGETSREWFNVRGGVTSNDFYVEGTGRVEFNFYVYDQSKNESSCKTTITVVADTEKPVITGCPASQTLTLGANGVVNSIVIFPKATDNVGVTSSVFNMRFFDGATDIANKTEYLGVFVATDPSRNVNIKGVGRLVLEWIYKDAAGNTSTCTSTITSISPTTDPCSTFNPVLSIAGTNCVNNEMSVAGAMGASYIEWKNDNQVVYTTAATSTKAANGTTIAGNSNGTAGNSLSQLNNPTSVFVDKQGNTYVVDINNERVLKFAQGSTMGNVVAGGNGAGDSPNQVNGPVGVFVDDSGNVYVSEFWNNRVTKWAPGSSTGTVVAGGNGAGANDNQLARPRGLYVDDIDNIYIADGANNRLMKWTSGATAGTIVGKDLNTPSQVLLDDSGNIYVSEFGLFQIQKFPPNATSATSGIIVAKDASGTATGLDIDGAGFIYLCNGGENRIMKYPPNSTSTTVGTDIAGGNGSGVGANQLNTPGSVFVDGEGVIYIADRLNNRVQRWTQTTTITPKFTPTVAGSYTADVFNIAGCKKTTNSLVITSCNSCENDTTPPSLANCPTNQAIVLESDGSGVFSLIDPTVTDNCDIASTELKMTYSGGVTYGASLTLYTTAQLMPLPLLYNVMGAGTIDVEYTATDDAGNITKCASVVKVVEASGPCLNDVTSPSSNNCPPNQLLNLVNGEAISMVTVPGFTDNCAVANIKAVLEYRGGVTNPNGETDRVLNNIQSGKSGNFTLVGAGKTTFEYVAADPSGNEGRCIVTYTTIVPGTDALFNIGSACAVAGQNVSFPVTVTRFNAIGAFSFDLEVPLGSGLSFVGLEREAIDNVSFNVLGNGDLRVSWDEPGGNNISLEDNYIIFNVVIGADASFASATTVTGKDLVLLSDINDQGSITVGNICVGTSVTPLGRILNPRGKPHVDVPVNLVTVGNVVTNTTTNAQGAYTFVFTNDTYRVRPAKNDEVRKGVSIVDVARIRRHFLQKLFLDDDYKLVAADVNKDGRINVLDVAFTNRVFLRKRDDFPNNTAWRFIPKSLDISSDPLDVNLADQIKLQTPNLDYSNLDFVSVKTGDVDHSALNNFRGNSTGDRLDVSISVPDTIVSPQEMVTLPVYMTGTDKVSALSFTMKYDTEVVELVSITAPNLKGFSGGSYNDISGEVLIGWDHPQGEDVDASGVLMMMTFVSKVTEGMSDITLEDANVFDINLNEIGVTSQSGSVDFMTSSVDDFDKAYKVTASPNPFLDIVNLTVENNTPQSLSVTFTDVTGKVLKKLSIDNKSTNHLITVDDIDAKGVIIVLVKGDNFSETLRLIKL